MINYRGLLGAQSDLVGRPKILTRSRVLALILEPPPATHLQRNLNKALKLS